GGLPCRAKSAILPTPVADSGWLRRPLRPCSGSRPARVMIVPATDESIGRAARLLRDGQLVSFPTETVYGLGADARNAAAVQRIFAAKKRPADHPLIVHIADASVLPRWARSIPAGARALADAFWPGPLTLILPRESEEHTSELQSLAYLV